jgi:SPP1 gp7 family putative phage head morphogenesis protein
MPDPQIVRDALDYRAALLRRESAQMTEMTLRWTQAERRLMQDINALLDEVAQRQAEGIVFGRTSDAYLRLERYRTLLEQTRREIAAFNDYAQSEIESGVDWHYGAGTRHAYNTLDALTVGDPMLRAQFDRLGVNAAQSIAGVLQPGAPIGQLLEDAWGDAAVRMSEALFNGVALGWNPRKTARAMADGMEGALQRALRIARTEQLRAYRTSSLDTYRQSGLVRGWKRLSAKSTRTCIACLLADGRYYDIDESFDSHVQCRCTLTPCLKNRPDPTWRTGREWFNSQKDEVQQRILGIAAWQAWQNGEIALDDLTETVHHPIYGASVQTKSLRRALGE